MFFYNKLTQYIDLMSWNTEKIAKLKELWGGGKTASQISEIIGGMSRNAAVSYTHLTLPTNREV